MHMDTMEGLVREVERICGLGARATQQAQHSIQQEGQPGAELSAPAEGSEGGEGEVQDATGPLPGGEEDTFTFDFSVLDLVGVTNDVGAQAQAVAQGGAAAAEGESVPGISGDAGTASEHETSPSTDGLGNVPEGLPAAPSSSACMGSGSSVGGSKLSQDLAAAQQRSEEQLK